jgi:hypothetical protein
MRHRLVALLAVALGACTLAGPASAAAPRYIMVSGGSLSRPILLADWRENMAIEQAVASALPAVPPTGLAVRPRLALSLFWGWGEKRPAHPAQANQRGWLYLAVGSQPALIALKVNGSSQLRVVPAALLIILRNHAVPTRQRLLSS